MEQVLDPKKKKAQTAQTAAEQASAIEKTDVSAATKGTAAGATQNIYDPAYKQRKEREAGQAVLDAEKFTPKTPQTTSGRVVAEYEGFGLGGASKIDKMAKEGKTVDEIVKTLGLRPRKKK